ncbi:MAG: DUF6414 family protein [Actinomycetales bacterium]
MPQYPVYLDTRALSALSGEPVTLDMPLSAATAVLDRWRNDEEIAAVDTVDDLANAAPGLLVELTGTVLGNPLFPVVDLVATMLPLAMGDPRTSDDRARRAPTPAAAAARAEEEERLGAQRVLAGVVTTARDALATSPVSDVLLRTDSGVTAVLVLDRTVIDPGVEEQLRDGRFTVLGKVTSVLSDGDRINLFRRTPLAATGVDSSRDMLAELVEAGVDVELSDPVVEGPALQLLPVAILV